MAASGSLHKAERLGVLDGLRGVAVLLVLWYHVWQISWLEPPPWLAFVPATGFVGVHLFFFLSGFVITYPFVRAAVLETASPSWGEFAWRRFIKIVPSYGLAIALAYAVGYAQTQPGASVVPDLVSHALFIHTWFPQRYGTIDGVLWTLAVEVEFYWFFPVIWACFRRKPWLTAGAMIAIAWLWRALMARCCFDTSFAQYEENLPGYLDIFALGMICSYVFVRFVGKWRASRWIAVAPTMSLAGLAMLAAAQNNLYNYHAHDQWSSAWQINGRLMLGAAFAVIALGWLASPRWWQVLLDNPPLRFLATISYNLYLYHQLIAREMLAHHIPRYIGDPHDDRAWQMRYTLAAFAVTIAQAAVITYLFERPLLHLKSRGSARTRAAT